MKMRSANWTPVQGPPTNRGNPPQMTKEDITEHIKDAIIRCVYQPGEKIVEAQICKVLGVGRSRVREAFHQLEQEDFIQRIPNASPVVKKLSQKDISQIWDLLGVLEGLSMRIATPTLSDKDIKQIEGLVEKMEQYQNSKFRMYDFNMKFHQFLTELGGNTRLISFVSNLREQARRMSLESFYNPQPIESSLREHRSILDAVKERQPLEAERLIREHYLTSKNRLLSYINNTL
jgi:DNA-binding GntR family transcriptional regulator